MPRFYTRTGDKGTSTVFGGKRLSKSSPLFTALGALDETNAALGIARATAKKRKLKTIMLSLQDRLFRAGPDIATPRTQKTFVRRITPQDIQRLETHIDALTKHLPPLTKFVIPGESTAGAHLHFARAVIRRAEREVTHAQKLLANPTLIPWLNRLSSLLFVLALLEDLATKKKLKYPSY